MINYAGEGLSSSSGGDEWVGRVRMMVDKLDTLKREQMAIKEELKSEQKAMKEELNSKIDLILQAVVRKDNASDDGNITVPNFKE